MSNQATDEEVGALKERIAAEIDKDSLEWIIELLPKLLARLEAVERERDRWKKLESEAAECVEMVIIHRSRYFTGEEPYVGWKGLGLALRQDFDERDRLREALRRIAAYDDGSGCCAYGCDTPSIATQALKEG